MRTQKATTLIKSCFYRSGGDGKKIGLESKRNKKSSRQLEKSDFEQTLKLQPTKEERSLRNRAVLQKRKKSTARVVEEGILSPPLQFRLFLFRTNLSF